MKWRHVLTFVLLFWFSVGCAVEAPSPLTEPANTAAGEVAFELAGPGGAAVVIPVRLNGEGPFDFVLDTGATLTCIDHELINRLGLPERHGQLGIGAGVRNQGNFKLVGVNSLEVGTAKASDLSACALDLRHVRSIGLDVQGLIGLNFLKSYRVIIDFERKIVQLQKP